MQTARDLVDLYGDAGCGLPGAFMHCAPISSASQKRHAGRKHAFIRFGLTRRALHTCNSTGEVLRQGSHLRPEPQTSDTCVFAWGVAPAEPVHSKEARD